MIVHSYLMKLFLVVGTAAALRQQPSQTDLVKEGELVTIRDCDGKEYTVPLAGTDSGVVSDLLTGAIVASDANGMASLIVDMANAKKQRLQALLAQAGTSPSALQTLLSSSSCEADEHASSGDTVARTFGEPVAVAGTGVMDDESVQPTGAVHRLLRPQQKFSQPVRMFHSDQENVKIADILPGTEDSLHLYQGDMVYAKQLAESTVSTTSISGAQDTLMWSAWNLWPGGKVNWFVDAAAPVDECAVATFTSAASLMEKYTCLRFQPKVIPSGGVNSIKLTSNENACWAYVGMSSQSQVNLGGPGCQVPGIALHELGHAVGLIHQQSRANRDAYVTIEWGNVKEAAVDNFKKIISGSAYDAAVNGKSYDYSSIMHYSACEFSTTRSASPCGKTIDPADPTVAATMGQREYLSQSDIDTLNSMYGCSATCGDGIQNQGEEGVDCGGPCNRVCNDPTSDGIVPLPDQCKLSATTGPLTTSQIYMICGAAAGVLIIIVLAVALNSRSKNKRKEAAKKKLLVKTKMTPQQLQSVMRQRAAQQAAAKAIPSAPPLPGN